jgi:hypothetical protein
MIPRGGRGAFDLESGQCASSGVTIHPPADSSGPWAGVASMAFVSSPDVAEETLYATLYDDWYEPHLFRVQLPEGGMVELGAFWPTDEVSRFITGSGAGQMFVLDAFIDHSISRMNFDDGRTTPFIDLASLVADLWQSEGNGGRWVAAGFVVWGDGFYLFIARADRQTSTAFRVLPSGEYEAVLEDVGTLVLSAAVSTCAPAELF